MNNLRDPDDKVYAHAHAHTHAQPHDDDFRSLNISPSFREMLFWKVIIVIKSKNQHKTWNDIIMQVNFSNNNQMDQSLQHTLHLIFRFTYNDYMDLSPSFSLLLCLKQFFIVYQTAFFLVFKFKLFFNSITFIIIHWCLI